MLDKLELLATQTASEDTEKQEEELIRQKLGGAAIVRTLDVSPMSRQATDHDGFTSIMLQVANDEEGMPLVTQTYSEENNRLNLNDTYG